MMLHFTFYTLGALGVVAYVLGVWLLVRTRRNRCTWDTAYIAWQTGAALWMAWMFFDIARSIP